MSSSRFPGTPLAGPQLLVLSSPVSGGACVNSRASHEGILACTRRNEAQSASQSGHVPEGVCGPRGPDRSLPAASCALAGFRPRHPWVSSPRGLRFEPKITGIINHYAPPPKRRGGVWRLWCASDSKEASDQKLEVSSLAEQVGRLCGLSFLRERRGPVFKFIYGGSLLEPQPDD